jgi:hypothetical protein
MLARLFRSNRPAVLTGLVVLVPALFLPALWNTVAASGPAMPLYGLLAELSRHVPWLPGLLHMLLVLLLALQLAMLANDAELLGKRTHLPALLFPLLLAAVASTAVLEAALVGMPLVLAAMRRTWGIALAKRVLGPLFDAGLLIGLASLFYLPYAFLMVVIWASISVIRPFHWREYVLPFWGTALPIYLAWAILHLQGVSSWQPMYTVVGQVAAGLRANDLPSVLKWLLRAVLFLLCAIAMVRFLVAYQRGIMREKNVRASFMALFFALAVIMVGVAVLDGSYPAVLLITPMAVFTGYALLSERRAWLSELAVTLLLGIALWVQWTV